MQITITGVHIEVTKAISEYVHQKFEIAKKYVKGDNTARLSVEISKTTEHHHHGDIYQVSAILIRKGKEKSLETISDDVYKSIDLMKDKLSRELSDEKDKEMSLFKRGAQRIKKLVKRNPS